MPICFAHSAVQGLLAYPRRRNSNVTPSSIPADLWDGPKFAGTFAGPCRRLGCKKPSFLRNVGAFELPTRGIKKPVLHGRQHVHRVSTSRRNLTGHPDKWEVESTLRWHVSGVRGPSRRAGTIDYDFA
jgi:hypothetical protein